MYFLTYNYEGVSSIGFLNWDKTKVIPAEFVFQKLHEHIPTDMIDLIETLNDLGKGKLKEALEMCSEDSIDLNDVKVLAPIPYPRRNVICLGKNYLEHIKEVKSLKNVSNDVPEKPIYFSKIASPAIGQNDLIDPHYVQQLDYEVELAVIIGKKCKGVKKENAEEYIFGYTIANDISARDVQTGHIQWFKGKSFDTFCPLGPYIMLKDDADFPPALEIKSYVNGELRQNSNTNKLIFDIPTIIEDLSSGMTLYPGDIILTGTPAGVGAGFNPPNYLKSGDIIECFIENIGTLKNKVK